jgi:hypothetical protein
MREVETMGRKWTREIIIRTILQCEAEGLPLTLAEPGVSKSLYSAGSREFGSWRNAVQAAGLRPQLANCAEKWPPSKILKLIRSLARRKHPLSVKQLEHRYGSMISAARRLFGSWFRAVLAAGADPRAFRRVIPWDRERVIEGILTRALRNEPLGARSTQPRSLVAAGQRFFGSWSASLIAAGVDPLKADIRKTACCPRTNGSIEQKKSKSRQHTHSWSREVVITAIQSRVSQQKPLNPGALKQDDYPLYRAGRRYFSKWRNALSAAGVDLGNQRQVEFLKRHREMPDTSDQSTRISQAADVLRLDDLM